MIQIENKFWKKKNIQLVVANSAAKAMTKPIYENANINIQRKHTNKLLSKATVQNLQQPSENFEAEEEWFANIW